MREVAWSAPMGSETVFACFVSTLSYTAPRHPTAHRTPQGKFQRDRPVPSTRLAVRQPGVLWESAGQSGNAGRILTGILGLGLGFPRVCPCR